jgi:hypothetical protein
MRKRYSFRRIPVAPSAVPATCRRPPRDQVLPRPFPKHVAGAQAAITAGPRHLPSFTMTSVRMNYLPSPRQPYRTFRIPAEYFDQPLLPNYSPALRNIRVLGIFDFEHDITPKLCCRDSSYFRRRYKLHRDLLDIYLYIVPASQRKMKNAINSLMPAMIY